MEEPGSNQDAPNHPDAASVDATAATTGGAGGGGSSGAVEEETKQQTSAGATSKEDDGPSEAVAQAAAPSGPPAQLAQPTTANPPPPAPAPAPVGRPKRGRGLASASAADGANDRANSPPSKRTRSAMAQRGTATTATDGKDGGEDIPRNNSSRAVGDFTNGRNQEMAAAASKDPTRWRAHQLADDYVEMASNLVLYPSNAPALGEKGGYGSGGFDAAKGMFPFDVVSALQYIKSPMRRPTVVERWSPLEIATFEASIAEHGKEFHVLQKDIKTKTTKEVVEFYYIWKKTAHYRRWKQQYVPPYLDNSDDDSEDEKSNRKIDPKRQPG